MEDQIQIINILSIESIRNVYIKYILLPFEIVTIIDITVYNY